MQNLTDVSRFNILHCTYNFNEGSAENQELRYIPILCIMLCRLYSLEFEFKSDESGAGLGTANCNIHLKLT